jgi:hypothetical protein
MFEHKTAPLIPRRIFLLRLARMGAIAAGIVFAALMIGTIGYKSLERLGWVDSILNASMILGGMGPIHIPVTTAGKLFASGYALFSGIVFLTVAAVLFAPLAHRMIHRFHLQIDEDEQDKPRPRQQRNHRKRTTS